MYGTGRVVDGMAVTGAGSLPCKHIFHLSASRSVKAWKELLGRCFIEAENRRLTSLAMPPVGTGMEVILAEDRVTFLLSRIRMLKSS